VCVCVYVCMYVCIFSVLKEVQYARIISRVLCQ